MNICWAEARERERRMIKEGKARHISSSLSVHKKNFIQSFSAFSMVFFARIEFSNLLLCLKDNRKSKVEVWRRNLKTAIEKSFSDRWKELIVEAVIDDFAAFFSSLSESFFVSQSTLNLMTNWDIENVRKRSRKKFFSQLGSFILLIEFQCYTKTRSNKRKSNIIKISNKWRLLSLGKFRKSSDKVYLKVVGKNVFSR